MDYLIPGEIITEDGDIELNSGKNAKTLTVSNTGDRPIQVGSHYHFFETNKALICLLYTSPSPRDRQKCRMPSSA